MYYDDPGAKAYHKAGFKEVGHHRKAVYVLGEYEDLVVMDILESEFSNKFLEYTLFRQPQ